MTTQIKAGVIAANAITASELASSALSGGTFTGDVTFDTTTLVVDSTNNRVGIGVASPLDPLHIVSEVTTDYRGNLLLSDSATLAAGVGGQIAFGGKFSGSSLTEWAAIQGTKTNATDGNYEGQLEFKTRPHNGALETRVILDSKGNIGLQGVQPSNFGAVFNVIEGGDSDKQGWIGIQDNDHAIKIGTNNYYSDSVSAYVFKYSARTSLLNISDDNLKYSTAASGTAGATITFTDRFIVEDQSMTIPRGTTAERPGSPVAGMVRYNTTENQVEGYNGSSWKNMLEVFTATGGTETTSGGYTYHTFTSSGTFQVTKGETTVEYLIVAGGGGGGYNSGSGGGAGGMQSGTYSVSTGSYTITVGAGGTGSSGSVSYAGSSSSAFGITSTGGGAGKSNDGAGTAGGSGGGSAGTGYAGASGTAGQGNDGGDGYGTAAERTGGGGGGKTSAGGDAVYRDGGDGGAGGEWPSGSGTYYAGGGGGGAHLGGNIAAGGTGGGGAGGIGGGGGGGTAGTSGTANTGGGGGAGSGYSYVGGSGGSGIVIIRYQ